MKKTIKIAIICIAFLTTHTTQETNQKILGNNCKIDLECSPPYVICRENTCKHKKIFPMRPKETTGMILLLALCLLAAASGIGGGALIVPILLMFFDFSTKEAIAFSNGLIFFTGAVKFFVALTRKHPTIEHKTLIDYNVVMILISTLLLGSFIGSTLATIFPEFLQLLGLILVILYSIHQSFTKSMKLWKKESIELLEKEIEIEDKDKKETSISTLNCELQYDTSDIEDLNHSSSEEDKSGNSEITNRNKENESENNERIEKLEREIIHDMIRKNEGNNFYWKKKCVVIGIFCSSMLIIFLRGGKGMKSIIGVKKCDTADWVLFTSYSILVFCFVLMGNRIVINEQKLKEETNWEYHKDEKIFDKKFIFKANILAFLVGAVSSIVGIGSGMIINPLLLSMDFLPQIVSFTGMYPTVINKFVASTVFLIAGQTPVDYLFFTGFLLSIGVVFVEWKVAQLVERLGRQSIISFLFAGILTIGLFLTLYVGFLDTLKTIEHGKSLLGFKNFCE